MKTLKSVSFFFILFMLLFVCATAVLAGKTKEASVELNVEIQKQKDGRVLVGFEKKETESVRVNIYDSEGYKVYSKNVTKGSAALIRFDMSHMPVDDYVYEVTNYVYHEDKTITK